MGKSDVVAKQYMRKRVRFADLINGSLFQGRQVVKPEHLQEISGESDLYLTDKEGKRKPIARYRDIVMKTDFAIFTEEGQNDIHYAMPVRGMVCDSLSYADQVKAIREEHEWNGDTLKKGEFLSGMTKDDKLVPVVNLVVYYGEEEWDASKELHEMLDFGESKEVEEILRGIVPNYRMNFIDVSKIDNTENYKSDLQTLFEMIKYRQDKNGMVNYIENHKEQLKQIDEDGLDMLGVFLHEEERFDKYRREGGGKATMCQAIDELFEELINKGRAEAEQEAQEKVKKAQEEKQEAQEKVKKVQEEKQKVQEEKQKVQEEKQKAQEESQKNHADFLQAVKALKEFLPCEVIAEKMNLSLDVVVNL